VPFAYLDNTVRNGYRYFYSVTAFDVNSLTSGPSSLSSPLVTQSVTPRGGSGQETAGSLGQPEFIDHGGNPVPNYSMPSLDRTTAQFNGPMAQTDVALGFAAFVPQIVQGTGALSLKVLDVTATSGNAGIGANGTYTFVLQGVGAPDTIVWPVHAGPFGPPFESASEYSLAFEAGPSSTAQSARYGGDSTFLIYGNLEFAHEPAWRLTGWGRGHINGAPSRSNFNGPRWWDGTPNENTPEPNGSHCIGSPGGCVQSPLTNTAGALTGVSRLFHILAYNTVNSVPQRDIEAALAFYTRAADINVYWGANGAVDSVIDVTHGVIVPFAPTYRASWGILNVASFASTNQATTADGNNGLITWSDIACVAPLPSAAFVGSCGGAAQTPAVLQNTAVLNPVAATSASYTATNTLAQTGTGFIFYLNGHNFLMQMAALPAAGTVWHARFYSGVIRGGGSVNPADGAYTFTSGRRPMNIPGLEVRISYTGTTFDPSVTTDAAMDRIHTVPDPYYVTSSWEQTTNSKILRFVNLPSQAIIRIYTVSGILVNVLTYNDPQAGGEATWNLRNRNNQFVASGVYFYHVEAADGRTKVGRFTVVNFAQ
jgi:hypothetical protein